MRFREDDFTQEATVSTRNAHGMCGFLLSLPRTSSAVPDPIAVGIPEWHTTTLGPPAQIRACGTTALGSCLGFCRQTAADQQLDVPASAHCARVPGTESGACFAVAGSPRPDPFPPHRPPRLAELCSGGSQVLRVRLTSHGRTSWDYGLGLAHATRWTIQRVAMRSPGSRA